MTVFDFKNMDEIPFGAHRLMGNGFALRTNKQVREASYWDIYQHLLNYESEDRMTEDVENYISKKLRIPVILSYSGVVKGICDYNFVMESLCYEDSYSRELSTIVGLHEEIFSSIEEQRAKRDAYIEYELNELIEYISDKDGNNGILNDDKLKQSLIDSVTTILHKLM